MYDFTPVFLEQEREMPTLCRRRQRALVEAIEPRTHFSAAYHLLSSGPLTENWTNTARLAVDDDWSNVPSIIGYRGDNIPGTPGKDPQTITTDDTVVDVNINRTSGSYATGGVAEFEITDPVVGIKGSGTAKAPYLQFHLNNSGMGVISMSYKLRDVDGGTNNSLQQVALQYRIADTGDWINIPAGYVADASDGPSLMKTTNVSLLLPSAVINQPIVQVRVITADAEGTDEYIGVDDISISSEAIPAVLLNEVNANPPTASDSAFEYFELKGTAGQSISHVYLLGIDGDQFSIGTVSVAIPLNSVSFGSNGLVFVKGTTGGFASEDAASTVVVDSNLTGGVLYNGSFSFMVVYSATPFTAFSVLDQDGNGTLEGLPAGTVVLDSIAWKLGGSSGDVIYGTELVATSSVTPDAASRLPGNTIANDASAWYYGDLSNTAGNASKGYLPGSSFNLPSADAKLTPGAANFAAPGAPSVQSTTFAYDNRPMALLVDFDKDVSASLVLSDGSDSSFILTNPDTNTPVPAASISKVYSTGDLVTLRFPGFTGVGGNGTLPDGNYRLTIVAANVKDAGNTPMAGNVTADFYFLNGDATRDRKVDTQDFNILVSNFGSGGQVFSHGDFNYDATVDSTDFGVLVAQYGKSLAAVPGAISAPILFVSSPSETMESLDLLS
jgi:hypothetical protein